MTLDEVYEYIRKLAKSSYWQTLYATSKDINIKLFKNDYDFTQLQVIFLRYLSFYYSIYLDIMMEDVDEEIVLDNFIYEDSYSYYKNKKKDKTDKKDNKQTLNSSVRDVWVFKKPNKVD